MRGFVLNIHNRRFFDTYNHLCYARAHVYIYKFIYEINKNR